MAVAPLWISSSCSPSSHKPRLGQVHDLGAGLGVLDLGDVDVLGAIPACSKAAAAASTVATGPTPRGVTG